MATVMFVFGTRPEFIKVYPVIREARARGHHVLTVSTGQHREMLDALYETLGERPDVDLEIMAREQTLSQILSRTVERLDPVVGEHRPDLIFVHGDTSATLAGSLVALYQRIPLAHIEAGLRTGNKYSPFPEEMNRRMTGVLADYHFAPTSVTRDNLLREGVKADSVFVVGNSAIDMLGFTVREQYRHAVLDSLNGKRLVLITVHRRENIGVLESMFRGINELAEKYEESFDFVYPIHMNPVVRRAADEYLTSKAIKIIEPLGTLDFHNVLARSFLVLTDSGGIQEEAPGLGKPVLVLRDTTERPEGVEAGTLKLVGTRGEDIVREASRLIDSDTAYARMANVVNPYGDGTTAKQIFDVLESRLGYRVTNDVAQVAV